MPDQPTITDQALDAAMTAADECTELCSDQFAICCIRAAARAAIEAAAPHIAAQALRHAASDLRDQTPVELGDAGWNALADRAEAAGYFRRSVLDIRRRDTFSTVTVEAAYQQGYRDAAKRLAGLAGRPGSAAPTRTGPDVGDPYGGTECEHGAPACDPPTPGCQVAPTPKRPADPWDVLAAVFAATTTTNPAPTARTEQLAHCPDTAAHTAHDWTDGIQTHRCPGSITLHRTGAPTRTDCGVGIPTGGGDRCTYSGPEPGPAICADPADVHLLIAAGPEHPNGATLAACTQHTRIARVSGQLVDEHTFGPGCEGTETTWRWDHCEAAP